MFWGFVPLFLWLTVGLPILCNRKKILAWWRRSPQGKISARHAACIEARVVADLFDSDPDGWVCDNTFAYHAGADICVWIANQDYAIRVYDGHPLTSVGPHRSLDVGVCPQLSNMGENPSRKYVWEAYMRWQDRGRTISSNDLVGRALKASAEARDKRGQDPT